MAAITAGNPAGMALAYDKYAADLGLFSPAELARLGLGARRGAVLIRLCRSIDLEVLKAHPTEIAARRLGIPHDARSTFNVSYAATRAVTEMSKFHSPMIARVFSRIDFQSTSPFRVS